MENNRCLLFERNWTSKPQKKQKYLQPQYQNIVKNPKGKLNVVWTRRWVKNLGGSGQRRRQQNCRQRRQPGTTIRRQTQLRQRLGRKLTKAPPNPFVGLFVFAFSLRRLLEAGRSGEGSVNWMIAHLTGSHPFPAQCYNSHTFPRSSDIRGNISLRHFL